MREREFELRWKELLDVGSADVRSLFEFDGAEDLIQNGIETKDACLIERFTLDRVHLSMEETERTQYGVNIEDAQRRKSKPNTETRRARWNGHG